MGLITTTVSGNTGNVSVTGSIQASSYIYAAGFGNSSSIETSQTVPPNYNSVLYGPITIDDGVDFIISANSAVKIIDIGDL